MKGALKGRCRHGPGIAKGGPKTQKTRYPDTLKIGFIKEELKNHQVIKAKKPNNEKTMKEIPETKKTTKQPRKNKKALF